MQFECAVSGSGRVKGNAAIGLRGIDGHLVILGSELVLMQVVEADGKVENVVGIVAFAREGREISLLRLAPALLPGIQVAEGEM